MHSARNLILKIHENHICIQFYRVGENQVWVRGQTNKEDYRVGRAYTIRKDKFGNYCNDLLKVN